MEVSSNGTSQAIAVEVQKKAQDVQSQQLMKVLESTNEQSKQMTAQKTGLGNSLNITG